MSIAHHGRASGNACETLHEIMLPSTVEAQTAGVYLEMMCFLDCNYVRDMFTFTFILFFFFSVFFVCELFRIINNMYSHIFQNKYLEYFI